MNKKTDIMPKAIASVNNLFASGHSACAGCGPAIAMRTILRATGPNVVVCISTGCMEVVSTVHPQTAWNVPLIHVTFENAASVAAGVREALDSLGKNDVEVLAVGGDGGLVDIGFGAVSGVFERGDNVLVICYDNEAYSNTGVQRSGATPIYASTTTTPYGKISKGKKQWKKDLPSIAAAHHIPYVATASIAYPEDLERKIKKAMSITGARYIHIHCPCIIGWGFSPEKTVEVAKLAVETKMWALYEIENGNKTVSLKPSGKPVKDYLKMQKRFAHLKGEDIKEIQKKVDEIWDKEFSKEG